jgi:hypothetical protein
MASLADRPIEYTAQEIKALVGEFERLETELFKLRRRIEVGAMPSDHRRHSLPGIKQVAPWPAADGRMQFDAIRTSPTVGFARNSISSIACCNSSNTTWPRLRSVST